MKKLLAALLISLALVSCSKNESAATSPTASTTTEASAPEANNTPSPAAVADDQAPAAGPIATGPIKEGVDYTVITTPVEVKPEPNGKINVKIFFGFWCIHCKYTQPFIDKYLKLNSAIDLDEIPLVIGNNKDVNGFAKLGATLSNPDLQQLNLDKLYNAIFNVTVTDKVSTELADPANLPAFLKQNGYTQQQITKFMATYNSFAISAKVAKYKAQALMYNIQGTPTIIVADKYLVSAAEPDKLMEVTLNLVNKVNQDSNTTKTVTTKSTKTISASAAK